MATINTRTIKSSLGDYTSLSAWEAGRQGDLVANDYIEVAECYAMADTSTLTISGSTVDSGHYMSITVATGQGHSGVWDANKYYIQQSLNVIVISDNYVRITGIQLDCTYSGTNSRNGINISGITGVQLNRNIIKFSGSSTNETDGIYCSSSTSTARIWNNIIYGWGTGGTGYGLRCAGTDTSDTTSTWCLNNTVVGCTSGIYSNYKGNISKNNLISGCTTTASGTFRAGTDYNATNNASMGYTVDGGGNSHDHTSHTFTFIGGVDYHLDPTDTGAIGLGTTDPGSGLFSDDIDGVTRVEPWDIGADQHTDVTSNLTLSTYDNITISENISKTAIALLKSIFDSVNVSENITLKLNLLISLYDSIETSDNNQFKLDLLTSLYDSISVSDSISEKISLLLLSIYDSVNMSENINGILTALKISIYDNTNIFDNNSQLISSLKAVVFDAVNIGEQEAEIISALRGIIYDLTNISEYLNLDIGDLIQSIYDVISINDNVSAKITALLKLISDNININESIDTEFQTAGELAKSIFDNTIIRDYVIAALSSISQLIYDGINVSDIVTSRLSALLISLNDNVSVTDNIDVKIILNRLIADTINVSDSITAYFSNLQKLVFDSVFIRDYILTSGLHLNKSVYDNVSLTEYINGRLINPNLERVRYIVHGKSQRAFSVTGKSKRNFTKEN